MPVKTFRGGVHPKDGKSLSENAPITRLEASGTLTFLLNQHIGAPAVPSVAVGDRVLVGQQLAAGAGFVTSCILSSVSGTVKAIEPSITQTGDTAPSIVVQSDGKSEKVPGFGDRRDFKAMSDDEILEAIRAAGIVGMGGAGFPASVKLAVKNPQAIDYILVNGAECEPYITCDYRMMLEKPDLAILGMNVVLRLFNHAQGIFGIETNKAPALKALRKAAGQNARISIVPLRKKYPQGGERMLISALTGRKIYSKMLPADAGCIVFNFSTLCAIAEAVCYRTPLIRRVVTVTGDAIRTPSNFDVPIGISTQELIDAAGGFLQEPEKIIFGGPMMGAAVYSLSIPVTKTTSCILCMSHDETAQYSPMECIRCGKCLTTCPERLMPIKLKDTADVGDYETFERLHGLECIGCGCCTYVCPAKRRLSQSITIAKRHILNEKKKAAVNKA